MYTYKYAYQSSTTNREQYAWFHPSQWSHKLIELCQSTYRYANRLAYSRHRVIGRAHSIHSPLYDRTIESTESMTKNSRVSFTLRTKGTKRYEFLSLDFIFDDFGEAMEVYSCYFVTTRAFVTNSLILVKSRSKKCPLGGLDGEFVCLNSQLLYSRWPFLL